MTTAGAAVLPGKDGEIFWSSDYYWREAECLARERQR
jgi:hypothetical protein